jgi:AraC family transcriptional regulator
MNLDQLSLIEAMIDTIEEELLYPLNLDELSRKAGISKYHLERLFKSLCNKSLISYVRGRRLSLSLHDLIHTRLKIIDIAVKYQFEYEQSYIRAFQNYFGITPAKYRRLRTELPIEQKLDIGTLTGIDQGFVIQPRMVIKPAFYIQGIKEEIFHVENLEKATTNKVALLFREQYMMQVPNRIHEEIYLAVIKYLPQAHISNDYIPCVETTVLNKADPPFVAMELPAQEYAVFRYVGFHSPLELNYKTMKELYDYTDFWLLNTKHKQPVPYHFERMDLSVCSDSYCEMDIYIPISSCFQGPDA